MYMKLMPSIFLNRSPPFTLWQGLLLNLNLSNELASGQQRDYSIYMDAGYPNSDPPAFMAST